MEKLLKTYCILCIIKLEFLEVDAGMLCKRCIYVGKSRVICSYSNIEVPDNCSENHCRFFAQAGCVRRARQ